MTGNAKLGIAAAAAAALGLGGGLVLWQKKLKPQPKPAPTAKTETRQESIHYFPIWEVRYLDKALGEVRGRAFVDWDAKHARVELIDPATDEIKKVYADSVELNGTETTVSTEVTFTFRGKSPAAPPTKAPDTRGMKHLSAKVTDKASITPAESAFEAEVKEKGRADLDQVKVTLSAGPAGMLRGSWSYKADPLTGRDRNGSGRQGYYRLLNQEELEGPYEGFLGEQSETEEWTPILPSIAAVKVIEDQLAYSRNWPLYLYPGKSVPSEYEQRSKQRTLFVVGRDFPVDGGKAMCGVSRAPSPSGQTDGPALQYSVEAVSTDPNIDAKHKEVMEEAWTTVLEGLTNEEKSLARSRLDAALVKVELAEGVTAGPKVFAWCGDQAAWFLQFGNNTAEARFIRPLAQKTGEPGSRDEFEYTDSIFLPEQLRVEVVSRASVAVAEFPVHIGRKGKDPSSWVTLAAHRIGDGLYRTDPFSLVDAGRIGAAKGVTIPASQGDKLQATVQLDDVQFIAPPVAEADVFLTPARAPESVLWREALENAQKAHVPEQNYHGVTVSTGQHAAMLLLQQSFVAQLKEELERVKTIETPEELRGFREWLKPFLAGNEHRFIDPPKSPVGWEKYPEWLKTIDTLNDLLEQTCSAFSKAGEKLFDCVWNGRPPSSTPAFGQATYWGELDVTGPNGGTWKFWETYFSDAGLEHPSGGGYRSPAELAKWRLDATREVLEQYKKKLKDAIDYAGNIKPTDLPGLIHLTGIDFSATSIRLMPRLVRLDESGGTLHWVPDPVARNAVANVSALSDAALANESYLDIRDKFIMNIVLGLLSAPAAIWDGASVAAYSWAANAGLTALQSGETIAEQFKVRTELDLLFGASGVIGATQLDDSMVRKTEWYMVVLDVAGSLLGEVGGAREHLPFLRKELAGKVPSMALQIRRAITVGAAADAVVTLEQAPLRVVAKLPEANRESLVDLFGRSATRLEQVGALSREEAEALYQARRLADEVAEAKTGAVLEEEAGKAQTGVLTKTEALPPSRKPGGPEPAAPAGEPPTPPTVATPAFAPEPVAAVPPWPPEGAAAGTKTKPWAPPENQPLATPIRPEAVGQARQHPLPNNPPKKTSWKAVTQADRSEIHYKIKEITAGSSSEVYEVLDIRVPDTAAGQELRKKALEGDGAVIKFLKDDSPPAEQLKLPVRDRKRLYLGSPREQIERMQGVYKLLEEARAKNPNIHFKEVLAWFPDADPPYFIQKKLVPPKERVFSVLKDFTARDEKGKVLGLKSYDEISKTFTPEMQELVPRLYRDLGALNDVGLDLSLPNLYVEWDETNKSWGLGILDIDLMAGVKATQPEGHPTWDWIRNILRDPEDKFKSVVHDGRTVMNGPAFMEKMLEYPYGGHLKNGWIRYSILSKRYEPVLIHPDIIQKYFPNFRTDLRQVQPKKSSSSFLIPVLPWLDDWEAKAKRMWAAVIHQWVPLPANG